jgi:hypothetical protein
MNHLSKGDTVRHITDPLERNKGVVVGNVGPGWLDWSLLKVKWESGVTENVHYTELQRVNA